MKPCINHRGERSEEDDMNKKETTILFLLLFVPLFFFLSCSLSKKVAPVETSDNRADALIIDHTCTDISKIHEYWIKKAKAEFGISYGHTSHGSQIVSGMRVLMDQSGLYSFDQYGSRKSLAFHDREPRGDLGNPDRTTWALRTRKLLDTGWGDTNIIMWSWCGQVSWASKENINTYLKLMDQLETDYPHVTFIYMTGHLDGTGKQGNLNRRNNQIRHFCTKNKKILFDFADIESYDPDGNYFMDKRADDECNYTENDVRKNWAEEWCNDNPGECSSCSCAHSKSLNCILKGKAFWWMMVRLAGWNPGG